MRGIAAGTRGTVMARGWRSELDTGKLAAGLARAAVLGIFSFAAMVPLAYVVTTSLKPKSEVFISLIPRQLTLENYPQAWETTRFATLFQNSLVVTAVSLAIAVSLATTAGYGFARLRFPGNRVLFFFLLMGLTIPSQVTLVPLFVNLKAYKLLNTYGALIGPYVAFGLPFATFIMSGFFKTLPRELEDAARIDGCGEFGTFLRVMLPLTKPGIATISIFLSLYFWNEFVFAVTFISKKPLMTIPLGLMSFIEEYSTNYAGMAAALTIAAIPIVLIFLAFQGQFIKGLTAGAVKQ
ncbi:MAG: carbohydrate ABC transporter permease [Chloroflexi bacterium]|nr:carbohydrate ABC transporter permease [Chloroflexota bacterium]